MRAVLTGLVVNLLERLGEPTDGIDLGDDDLPPTPPRTPAPAARPVLLEHLTTAA